MLRGGAEQINLPGARDDQRRELLPKVANPARHEKGGVPFRASNSSPGGSRVEGGATDLPGRRQVLKVAEKGVGRRASFLSWMNELGGSRRILRILQILMAALKAEAAEYVERHRGERGPAGQAKSARPALSSDEIYRYGLVSDFLSHRMLKFDAHGWQSSEPPRLRATTQAAVPVWRGLI